VSAWPSQLLRLSAALFAVAFSFGAYANTEMKNDLQGEQNAVAFALPSEAAQLGHCDVFCRELESEANNAKVVFLPFCGKSIWAIAAEEILLFSSSGYGCLCMTGVFFRGVPNYKAEQSPNCRACELPKVHVHNWLAVR